MLNVVYFKEGNVKVTKREIKVDDKHGTLFVVYFIDSKDRKKYMVTRIEDRHVIYTEQFMTEYLRAMRIHGEWDETL